MFVCSFVCIPSTMLKLKLLIICLFVYHPQCWSWNLVLTICLFVYHPQCWSWNLVLTICLFVYHPQCWRWNLVLTICLFVYHPQCWRWCISYLLRLLRSFRITKFKDRRAMWSHCPVVVHSRKISFPIVGKFSFSETRWSVSYGVIMLFCLVETLYWYCWF